MPPRGIILDIDGTMYAQAPVRVRMALRLARAAAVAPREGVRWWRVLSAYRSAQEELRAEDRPSSAADQMRLTIVRAGVEADEAQACVRRWMHEAPCDLLPRYRRSGLREFLDAARSASVPVGVYSDYPAGRKLEVLGIASLVNVVRSSHDDDIGRFKPSPAGLLAVARALGVPPGDCVHIGDRPEVDGVAAEAAGMKAFIVTRRERPAGASWEPVGDFTTLGRRLGLA